MTDQKQLGVQIETNVPVNNSKNKDDEQNKEDKNESLIFFEKHRSFIIEWTIYFTLFFEDLCALFWQSNDVSDRTVFWIFYGFGFISGAMDACLALDGDDAFFKSNKSLNYALLISTIMVETLQSILFMIYCDGAQIYPVFIIWLIIQVTLEIYKFIHERKEEETEKESSETVQIETENEAVSEERYKQSMAAVGACCIPIVIGALVMPLIYYSGGAFRSVGFDVYVTFVIWAGTVIGSFGDRLNSQQRNYILTVFLIINGIIIFLICLTYLDSNGFDLGWSWFIIIAFPCCCCCCIWMSYESVRDQKREKRIYEFVMKYGDNGCSLEDIKKEMIDLKEEAVLDRIKDLKDDEALYTKNGNEQHFYANPNPYKWKH